MKISRGVSLPGVTLETDAWRLLAWMGFHHYSHGTADPLNQVESHPLTLFKDAISILIHGYGPWRSGMTVTWRRITRV